MKVIESGGPVRMLAIGLGPGELLLESVREAVVTHGVRDGAVVSGVGTLKRCRLHYVNTTGFPPENRFYVIEEPVEVGSISGLIVDYEPHLHMSVGCREDRTWVGHLEEGSVVLYLAEVCVLEFGGPKLIRRRDEGRGVSLLDEER